MSSSITEHRAVAPSAGSGVQRSWTKPEHGDEGALKSPFLSRLFFGS
jgi:hypothetical protein